MKKTLYILIGTGLLSCSNTGNADTDKTYTDKARTEFNAISQCLEDKNYQYETLLTKADIAKYVPIDEASFKEDIASRKDKYGSCVYSWTSDRPEKEIVSKATGATFKRPDRNKVTIKLLDFYTDKDLKTHNQDSPADLFDQGYKKLSQAEYDELLANLEQKLRDKPEDLARAKKMLDRRMKFKYKPVETLGDRAYWKWTDYGVELVVLAGRARFTILSKTAGDPETALEHATHFAREVLAKCAG